eukprot:TRINITY_DN7395_c0_g1_i2.p1 TRINITY_DN7395_c0_g1~~TRINITY_DN7395_c0_g1_i2.p1  ORF type:complete len:636 (+),score=165.78 TRINITY_DN7395_c0_g1_i2:36-1943(+)
MAMSMVPVPLRNASPPFETPCATQIMRNFMELQNFRKSGETKKRAIEKLAKILLQMLNKMELPRPGSLPMSSKQKKDPYYNPTGLSAFSREKIYRTYPTYYELWERYCRPQGSVDPKDMYRPVPSNRTADYFGRSLLIVLLPTIQAQVLSSPLTRDLESFGASFFSELEKELENDVSVIHINDFNKAFTSIRYYSDRISKEGMVVGVKRRLDGHDPSSKFIKTTADEVAMSSSSSSSMSGKSIPAPRDANDGDEGSGMVDQVMAVPVDPNDPLLSLPKVGPEGGLEPIGGRDLMAKQEEKAGILTSVVIRNDGRPENLIRLIRVRDIFSQQLPKMPRDYITRLVLDWNHQSLLLLKQSNIVGGICFRPFREQGFIEIAFCAITGDEQVKGYGTHLMNHLKSKLQPEKLLYFLTYADNFAIGYFKKQGFTKYVTMPREVWAGFIKDYDGGTLMECKVHPKIDYLKISEMVQRQRAILSTKIRNASNSHIVHKGIPFFKNGTQKRLYLKDIEGIKESRWKIELEYHEEDLAVLEPLFREVLRSVKNHPDSWPFREPVDAEEVPDYYKVIQDPIDLTVIEARLDTGSSYITKDIFYADLRRMLDNCRLYNKDDTVFYQCANNLQKFLGERYGALYFAK